MKGICTQAHGAVHRALSLIRSAFPESAQKLRKRCLGPRILEEPFAEYVAAGQEVEQHDPLPVQRTTASSLFSYLSVSPLLTKLLAESKGVCLARFGFITSQPYLTLVYPLV